MLPDLSPSPETTVKMISIMETKDVESGCHKDNTDNYLILMLFKFGLDIMAHYLCSQKRYTTLVSMCNLSILLADLVMVVFLAGIWLLGPERYILSLCFLLAKASATYEALPLPMTCLALLDYCLEDTHFGKQSTFCKSLRNAILTLLVWMAAVSYSYLYARSELMEMDYGSIMLLVCEVRESELIAYFIWGVFIAIICAMLPFWSMIPQWVREADRIAQMRKKQDSDLMFTSTNCTETKSDKENYPEENYPEETIQRCPPLWFSLTLGFGLMWMPYLAVSVASMLLEFAVPAYITVNLLWLECTNSLLLGVLFWANSKTQGPYSKLTENVCWWQIYWELSIGTQHQQLPIAVLNSSKGKEYNKLLVEVEGNTVLYL